MSAESADDELARLIAAQRHDDDRYPKHWPRFGSNTNPESAALALEWLVWPAVGDVVRAGVEWDDPTADEALGIDHRLYVEIVEPRCANGCDRVPYKRMAICDPCRQRAQRRARDPLVGTRPRSGGKRRM